jgi:UDP-N-acetylmuramate dehydrogenase
MEFQKNISLKEFNTFGMDINCSLLYNITSENEIINILDSEEYQNNKHLILSGGSNLLFTTDFDGLILKNNIKGIEVVFEDNNHTYLKVGSGENWHDFVLWTIKQGLSGLENMSLIPGNVGTAPIQNIGAYGVEVKDVITKVRGINLEEKKLFTLSNVDCDFRYRDSIFKNKLKDKIIITEVIFKLSRESQHNTKYGAILEELQNLELEISTANISKAVISIRERKLPNPKKLGNSGSFFKNPIINNTQFSELQKKFSEIVGYKNSETETKIAAGWLIEQCGWKGYRKGDAGVHKNQALVLVNYGNAKGEEIIALAKEIQQSVKDKFGINIHPEVNIIG